MIRVAIAGTGAVAERHHLPALRAEAGRVTVVAAMDTDAERAGAFCAAHGIPAAYPDLDRMLAEVRPDVVLVCTPAFAHAEHVVACLEAGAWVLCEQPTGRSLAEFDTIMAAENGAYGSSARSGGPYAAFGCPQRFGPGARRLRALIDAGRLGRPLVAQCVTAWHRDQTFFDAPGRGTWDAEGGGPTLSLAVHQLDLMLWLLGEWHEVRAMAGRLDRSIETEDVSMAAVRFDSGAMASVVNSVLSPRQESYLRLDFAAATVELRRPYGSRDADWTYTPAPHGSDEAQNSAADAAGSAASQLRSLLDAYERGERPDASGADGRRAIEFVTGLYKSALTGTAVRRVELRRDEPFYHHLHGNELDWAPMAAAGWERW